MIHFTHLLSAAAFLSVASAAPMVRRDGSAIGIEANPVSAPNGILESDSSYATATPSAGNYQDGSSGSYGGSGYGGSSVSSSGYGSSGYGSSGYGSAQNGYGDSQYGGNSYDSSSDEATSTYAAYSSYQTMMDDATSTYAAYSSYQTMATSSSSASYAQMTYGSGSSSWGGSGYDSCVQQCAASYAPPPATWTPPTSTQDSSDSYGGSAGNNGVTHTIIVAPTEGVLRYVPFSTNASVGDTVSFQWGAGPHTVTQSSALEVCNKTSAPGAFASGMQNKSFVFNQVINNTNPIWFYCGVPGHCEKGMFGGINIGQADPTGSSDSYMPLSDMMSNITSMSSDMQTLWGYTKNQTGSDAYANNWGMSTNCAGMTPDAMMQTAENVMYMQTLIAKNPQAVTGGKFAVNDASSLVIPADFQAALSSSSPDAAPSVAAAAAASAPSSSSATSSTASPPATTSTKSGAGSIASSSIAVGLVAIAATFFAL